MPFCFFWIRTSLIHNYKILNPKENPDQIPFLLVTIQNNGLSGDYMAKSHYSIKKRNKEQARKLKQEQKRQRKLNKDKIEPEENPDESEHAIKNLQA